MLVRDTYNENYLKKKLFDIITNATKEEEVVTY